MEKLREGLPYENLPQTIKDAITVTMSFGVSHLWVDALCIIQDSDDDKAQEISRMGDIYEQAHFTITAARAKMVEEGFLHSRSIAGERAFRIPYLCVNGDLGSVVFWTGRGNSEAEPTETRAWCFQSSLWKGSSGGWSPANGWVLVPSMAVQAATSLRYGDVGIHIY